MSDGSLFNNNRVLTARTFLRQKRQMANLMNLEIAGVNITVRCSDAIILPYNDPSYKSFIKTAEDRLPLLSADIKINLELGNLPQTGSLSKKFDSGQAWSIYPNNNGHYIEFRQTGAENKPLFLAEANHDFTDVTVYCGERLIKKTDDNTGVSSPFCYPLDQIILMHFLAHKGGAIVHAAGADLHGKGYIFPGKSGAGKSTLSKQFAFTQNIEILSDDRIAVRKTDNTFKAFGTPWPGEGKIAVNKTAPLAGIFFIIHADNNRISEISPQKAVEKLLPVVSIPWYNSEIMTKTLLMCENLTSGIPAYELYFKPDTGIADLFEKFITG
jgi:hypothetical protein